MVDPTGKLCGKTKIPCGIQELEGITNSHYVSIDNSGIDSIRGINSGAHSRNGPRIDSTHGIDRPLMLTGMNCCINDPHAHTMCHKP
jgi:hypothetical protein